MEMKGNILSGGKVTQKVKQHGRVPQHLQQAGHQGVLEEENQVQIFFFFVMSASMKSCAGGGCQMWEHLLCPWSFYNQVPLFPSSFLTFVLLSLDRF